MIQTINREDLLDLVKNDGQSEVGDEMIEFANRIPEINCVDDLVFIDKEFYRTFKLDSTTKKFARTSNEIFLSKTYSGCSDIGLVISSILRIKNIPTIYVESARLDWIKHIQKSGENICMQGHIFLEVYLNDTWYLYDPTGRVVYMNYDYNNCCLPRDYYAFVKAHNSFEVGVYSVDDEKNLAITNLKNLDTNCYENPDYLKFDLRDHVN